METSHLAFWVRAVAQRAPWPPSSSHHDSILGKQHGGERDRPRDLCPAPGELLATQSIFFSPIGSRPTIHAIVELLTEMPKILKDLEIGTAKKDREGAACAAYAPNGPLA